jgi:hypothetical protein
MFVAFLALWVPDSAPRGVGRAEPAGHGALADRHPTNHEGALIVADRPFTAMTTLRPMSYSKSRHHSMARSSGAPH